MSEVATTTLNERAEQAQRIIQNPAGYKVCVCCDSIVTDKVIICPNCHGYNYDDSAEVIIAQAHFLGTREQNSVLASDLEG